ncbi:hypothetical protein GUJ93_ZPchr0009g432 [Zizania palustris]|uniref:Auxin-responsive protein n=1 Tax=Zizania palustris TaxID=103762 RepID=A0A8J5VKS3_ZIZPA|nr:hypothetical protein GUJ93_ZPchr0009g432 [Zizania palustris]
MWPTKVKFSATHFFSSPVLFFPALGFPLLLFPAAASTRLRSSPPPTSPASAASPPSRRLHRLRPPPRPPAASPASRRLPPPPSASVGLPPPPRPSPPPRPPVFTRPPPCLASRPAPPRLHASDGHRLRPEGAIFTWVFADEVSAIVVDDTPKAVDGAPYLRKVDLEAYAGYDQLLRALQDKFFSHFTIRKFVYDERKLVDVVNGTEYVPTYEDKDGDWMLVGDVPWK